MNRLFVYSDRYAKEVHELKNNDYLVLQDAFSICTWKWLLKYKQINTKINIITVQELMKGELDNMKFDYIVGNPPYQANNSKSDAGSLYVDITKKALTLLKPNGIIDFITPTTIAQTKKDSFTLQGMKCLKILDYSTDKYFNVGIKICRWKIDKSLIFLKK